jgi:hypothetical protein
MAERRRTMANPRKMAGVTGGKLNLSKRILKPLPMALFAVAAALAFPSVSPAQPIRGQYTPGMNATNSGTLPEPGFTYMNYFQWYSFDQLKGPGGNRLPASGNLAVMVDHNLFIGVSKQKLFGAEFALLADLPIATSSLTSDTLGSLSAGGGFADSFYQPFTLGWSFSRADIMAGYSFIAPTGKFALEASDNVGAGYWAQTPFSGQTVYLTTDKRTVVSAYELYEIHSKQKDTDIKPGQTFNIDYSIMRTFPFQNMQTLLQIGAVGYGQYQTTTARGPDVDPVTAENNEYRLNALGAAANIIFPMRKTSLGVRFFKEFANSSTIQGKSLQLYAVITF